MSRSFILEIVSHEREIFSGKARKLFASGVMGGLEIMFGHAPLLTTLAPGYIWTVAEDGTEDGFVLFGGILEVQPEITIVLADAALVSQDMNEAEAEAVKCRTEKALVSKKHGIDYKKVHDDLIIAKAELEVLRKLRSL